MTPSLNEVFRFTHPKIAGLELSLRATTYAKTKTMGEKIAVRLFVVSGGDDYYDGELYAWLSINILRSFGDHTFVLHHDVRDYAIINYLTREKVLALIDTVSYGFWNDRPVYEFVGVYARKVGEILATR